MRLDPGVEEAAESLFQHVLTFSFLEVLLSAWQKELTVAPWSADFFSRQCG